MRCFFAYILLVIAIFGCSDDDGQSYPSMHTDMAEVHTGSDKNVVSIELDDGRKYNADRTIRSGVADTTYRCLCSYTLDDDKSAESFHLYNITAIMSSYPKPYSNYKDQENSPVKLFSMWESPRYINAHIGYKTTDKGTHIFSFCEEKIETSEDGTKTAYVILHHKRPANDPESYTKHTYISFPKYYYDGKADKVVLRIDRVES